MTFWGNLHLKSSEIFYTYFALLSKMEHIVHVFKLQIVQYIRIIRTEQLTLKVLPLTLALENIKCWTAVSSKWIPLRFVALAVVVGIAKMNVHGMNLKKSFFFSSLRVSNRYLLLHFIYFYCPWAISLNRKNIIGNLLENLRIYIISWQLKYEHPKCQSYYW